MIIFNCEKLDYLKNKLCHIKTHYPVDFQHKIAKMPMLLLAKKQSKLTFKKQDINMMPTNRNKLHSIK